MTANTLSFRKELGLFLLGVVLCYWLALPILPFLAFPHKALVISGLVVAGEILPLVAIAILGKEYWGQIKQWPRQLFRWPGKSRNDNG
ncbi:transporter suffix domain-containing protein [Pseudomonas sp. NPDC089530]|uniref:transporter suffix domain-containing protein n=1 Tax=Pseudomonas sp. NPDC089530 TaxID=3390651 RepID=UPI003CFEF8E0